MNKLSREVQDVDRCEKAECEDCHHSGPLDADGYCLVDVRHLVDPEGPFHGQTICGCKCVFSSTSVSEVEDKTSGEGGKEHRASPSTESQATSELSADPTLEQAAQRAFDVVVAIEESEYNYSPLQKAAMVANRVRHASAVSQWRDIATAPKDGTRILVAHDGTKFVHRSGRMPINIVRWIRAHHGSNSQRRSWFLAQGVELQYAPTHWQPLPAPPEVNAPADKGDNSR